jgi:2-dehydro-3-deoxy-D-gluconate 5-dehydrogenase
MENYLQVFSLTGKVSMVTGAGRGIGLAIARALAGAGSDLALVSRTAAQLTAAAHTLRGDFGCQVLTSATDVSRTENLAALVDEVVARFGRLDVLVNNAGWNIRKPFFEVTPEEFDQLIQIHLKTAYFLSQLVAKAMVAAGVGGKIINLSSLSSQIGMPNISIYGAAKGGVFALTKALARELAPHRINVNALAPGYVRTAMTEAAFQDEERYQWMLSRIPLGRFGTPQDIGNAALFLASPASDYITGEVLFIDGGWMSA